MTTLIVIAKTPVAGKVKTRLCPPCTPDEAARIAAAALHDTLAAVDALTPECRRVIALDGGPGPWIPASFEIVAQRGNGLDERLAAAFDDAAHDHPDDPIVLIGMDTPQVTTKFLIETIDALRDHDSVLGLTHDGGWWCIGLHSPDPRVFLGVPMSTSETGQYQRDRMLSLGYTPAALLRLRDVDFFDDAIAVANQCAPTSEFRAAVRNVAERVTIDDNAQTDSA